MLAPQLSLNPRPEKSKISIELWTLVNYLFIIFLLIFFIFIGWWTFRSAICMVRQRIFLALSKSAYLLAHWQNGPWKADKIWPYFRSTSRKSPNLSLPSAKIGEWSLCTSFGLYEQTFYAFYSTIGMFKWICLLILLDIILIKPFFQHSIFIKIKQIKNQSFFMVIRIWFKHL